jgi:6-phosphogluconolactonase
MNPILHISKDPSAVANEFAEFLTHEVKEADKLNIALSGGSTPQLLFDILASEYKSQIEWSKVHFYWGDERCVPPADPESNFGMTKRHLFSHLDVPEENIHRILGENDPAEEAVRYSKELERTLHSSEGLPCFDIVMLGMGTDGHTASIFPHQMGLLESPETCVVATNPESGQKRVSISGRIINNAKKVIFLMTGTSKAQKIQEILTKQGNWLRYPASYIQPKSRELHWFLDESASALMR